MKRITIIGTGNIADRYAKSIESIDEIEIYGFIDPSPKARKKRWVKNLIQYDSIDNALYDNKTDIFFILTPNNLHYSQVKHLIQSGAHVFCEKPLALTSEQIADLIEEAKKQKTRIYAAMHSLFRPEIEFAFDYLKNKQIKFIRHRYKENWSQAPSWYYERKTCGGGVLLDVGINHLHWIDKMCGRLTPIKIYLSYSNKTDIECECEFNFSSGNGTVEWSWNQRNEVKSTEIFTTGGDVLLLDHKKSICYENGVIKQASSNREYEAVVRDFLRGDHLNDLEIANNVLETMRLVEFLYENNGEEDNVRKNKYVESEGTTPTSDAGACSNNS